MDARTNSLNFADSDLWEQGCQKDPTRNGFIIPKIADAIKKHNPISVLDVGCSTGYIGRAVRNLVPDGPHWTEIDCDTERISYAISQSKNCDATYLNADVFSEGPLGKFGLVIIANSLLEFTLNEVRAHHIAALVEANGLLAIFMPDTLQDTLEDDHALEKLSEFAKGSSKLEKVDKFTGRPYPFVAHRPISVVQCFMALGFIMIDTSRTEEGSGAFYFLFRLQASSS